MSDHWKFDIYHDKVGQHFVAFRCETALNAAFGNACESIPLGRGDTKHDALIALLKEEKKETP